MVASGEANIRGIDIDKLAKGFADEDNVMKKFVTVSTTKAREIRWYQKTAGFLDSVDTTGITASQITNTSFRSLPVVVEQSWTRNTSYVKKFFVTSPLLSVEDINDTDIDILATNIRDLVRGVERQVDKRIVEILTDANPDGNPLDNGAVTVQNTTSVADGWNDAVTGNPIKDILVGKRKIRQQGYNPEGSMLGMNSIEHEFLLDFLISVKGSSIPAFSSEKVRDGVVMGILGTNVLVSENFTTDWVIQWVPDRAVTWKAFMPISSVVIDEPLIGKTIRVSEWGEAILTDPNAVHVISNTTV